MDNCFSLNPDVSLKRDVYVRQENPPYSLRPRKKLYVWSYTLKTIRVGRYDCFFTFVSSLFFFSIQRAYGTMKQNLAKFQYTEVII